MQRTLIQILPLAVGATFSPSGLLLMMAILSSKENPRRKALSFLLGATAMLVLLAAIVLLIFRPKVLAAAHPDWLSGLIDILLALLISMLVLVTAFRKKKQVAHQKKKRRIPYMLVGFSFMLVNASTLVLYIAGCKLISESNLEWLESVVLLFVLIVVTMALVSFPVLISYAMPKQSQRILGPVTSFMTRHGNRVAQVYFMLMAAYLMVHGIRIMAG
jgi:hypothetical protein